MIESLTYQISEAFSKYTETHINENVRGGGIRDTPPRSDIFKQGSASQGKGFRKEELYERRFFHGRIYFK